MMLALHGFDAYGLEISETAVREAERYASSEMKSPSEYHYRSKSTVSRPSGAARFSQGDFFSADWTFKDEANGNTKFDIAYDYTVSSAILDGKSEN